MKTTLGKLLYGFTFCVVLPVLLFVWACALDRKFPALPSAGGWALGLPLVVVGVSLMLWGTWTLWDLGGGLPMNAFPPQKLVVDGIYAWVPNPIYAGFVLLCFGVSLFCGSATGVFLTTPLTALSAVALVLGHERLYLLRTFGELPRPVLGVASLLGPLGRAMRVPEAWDRVLGWTERLANSWKATRIGSARVINHAVFAGLAGGVGAFIVVLVAGKEHTAAVSLLMVLLAMATLLLFKRLGGRVNL
jgi:phosphatidylglycerol:prolipoprotein diacylglycerol transferase